MKKNIFMLAVIFSGLLVDSVHANIQETYEGHTYELVTEMMYWEDAKVYAESEGGYLVVITSAGENNFVCSLARQVQGSYNNNIWIGLTDANTEGSFTWVNGEAFSYSNWLPGQPDSMDSGEDYVQLLSSSSYNCEWNDTGSKSHNRTLYFVVEYPTAASTSSSSSTSSSTTSTIQSISTSSTTSINNTSSTSTTVPTITTTTTSGGLIKTTVSFDPSTMQLPVAGTRFSIDIMIEGVIS